MKAQLFQRIGILIVATLLASPTGAYNYKLAADYADMFEPVAGAAAGKNLHLIKVDKFVSAVNQGEKITTVDIRTPGETRFFTANLPGHLSIPISELFKTENLDLLPEEGKIVVLCKSGTRASAAAAGLRHIGFENTYVLKGGFKALAGYLGAKEAYPALGPKAASK